MQAHHAVAILVAFHILFFFRFYLNPMNLATSELLEIAWGHWRWMGRQLWNGKSVFKDDIYYKHPACIPFLSTFYPPHLLSALASRILSDDNSFKVLVLQMLNHFLIASILAYAMFSQWYTPEIALFGSLTLTYMAYNIKPYNLSFLYTIAWIPGIFIKGWVGVASVAMGILGGGWPVLVYVLPLLVINPHALWGIVFALPQIIPFLWYFPKSIKSEFSKVSQTFGRLKLRNFLDLLIPCSSGITNGIFYPEVSMYLGILPLCFIPWSTSRMALIAIVCVFFMFGLVKSPFRAPCRFIYTFSLSLIWMSCNGLSNLGLSGRTILILTILQGFCLLQNKRLILPFPFYQLQRTPSEHIASYEKGSFRYPFSTGYYFGEQTRGYTGGFCLKSVAERLGVTDPNGEPFYR